jgi:hypothetical protein
MSIYSKSGKKLELKYLIHTFLIALASIIAGCAQILPLSGGEKDTEPPKILSAKPSNYSTNFNAKQIEFQFDEYVKLSKISQEFISSPPLKYRPEFIEKGKSVVMKISDTLQPNTTYNMNFGNGIVDFTEGNPLDSNLFVFSTGDALDSMDVIGQVIDAYTGKEVKDVTAILHKSMSDTALFTLRPDYIAKTQEDGTFQLGFLPISMFQLFVVEDKNSNYKVDGSAERVGFLMNSVNSADDSIIHKIKLFKPTPEAQLITKQKPQDFTTASMKFDLPVKEFSMTPINEQEEIGFYEVWNDTRDSLTFTVFPGRSQDSLQLLIKADSIIDTVIYKMPSYEKFLKSIEKGKASVSFSFQANTTASAHKYFDTLFIEGNHPFSEVNRDSISLVVAGDTLPSDSFQLITTPIEAGSLTAFVPKVAVIYPWRQDVQHQLIYYPGAITDVYGLNNSDTLTQSFKTLSFEDYGKLTLKFEDWPKGQLVLEILDSKGEVIKKEFITNQTKVIDYDIIQPGKYGMRIIIDSDENGKWTTGDIKTRRQPEEIYYFPKQIDVRANWEIDYDWKFIPSK